MTRAYIALGSNLGDRLAHLRGAVEGLARSVEVRAVSSIYETEPVGGPPGQQPYLNAVVEVEAGGTARRLFSIGQELEREAGRVRGERWGPRTLDCDLLLFGEETISEDDLVVPHPRMGERRFVLEPLAEIAPQVAGRFRRPPGELLAGGLRRMGSLEWTNGTRSPGLERDKESP